MRDERKSCHLCQSDLDSCILVGLWVRAAGVNNLIWLPNFCPLDGDPLVSAPVPGKPHCRRRSFDWLRTKKIELELTQAF